MSARDPPNLRRKLTIISNYARGQIMVFNSSEDTLRRLLYAQILKNVITLSHLAVNPKLNFSIVSTTSLR